MTDKEKERVVIENEHNKLGMKLCFIEQSRIFLHYRSVDRSTLNFDYSFRLELILDIDLSSLSLLTGRLSSMMFNAK